MRTFNLMTVFQKSDLYSFISIDRRNKCFKVQLRAEHEQEVLGILSKGRVKQYILDCQRGARFMSFKHEWNLKIASIEYHRDGQVEFPVEGCPVLSLIVLFSFFGSINIHWIFI